MKVLLFTPYTDRLPGGDAKGTLPLINEIGKLVEIHLVCFPYVSPPVLLHGSTHYLSFSLVCGKAKETWLKLLKEVEPDIIHVSDCGMYQSAMALKWAKEAGYRIVLSPQGILDEGMSLRLFYQKGAMGRANGVVVMTEAERTVASRYCSKNKIVQIVNGVETGRKKMNGERRKKFLLFNRKDTENNMISILEAVALLKHELMEYRICVVDEGNPCFTALLKEKTKEMGIDGLFDFYEAATIEQIGRWMMQAELFIALQQTGDRDMNVARALACGTPVIVSQNSQWKEVEDDGCGWRINMNTKNMVEIIEKELSLPESERTGMGCRGRKLVKEKYSMAKMATELVDTYSKVMEQEKTL